MQPCSEYTEVSDDCVALCTCSNIIQMSDDFNGIIYHIYQITLEFNILLCYILYTRNDSPNPLRGRKRKDMKKIGEVISEHRKNKKLSQVELSEKLSEKKIEVSNAAISAWEKGNSMPSAEALLATCEILGISDIYTEFIGANPMDPFKDLNEEGRQKVLDYAELLVKSGEYKKPTNIIEFKPRTMKVALTRASAGTGNFLDEENFDEMEVLEPVPEKADFGVYIDGDSMEPRFHNEELVWIEQTEALESGDIGLFFLDGLTYIKKYVVNNAGTFLVSLNAKYKPLEVGEFSTFKIFGKLAVD